ncbi:unnamed protein product [Thlaspi arvense]|uniref:Protein root UVB sensitive 3 n=1 Tax=Thlaspi arvense TaxID=13288 RepID=A0AAU9RQY4_THLAR|nr:unnamed protein product [Thlaspi arvense]
MGTTLLILIFHYLFTLCYLSAGVASGATRAALTQHFALQDNAADISAKEGSQETLATMIGMALGMLLARFTMGHPIAIWLSFLSLTIFHMYANYNAVRCLSLTTLNCERSSILLQHFMKTGQDNSETICMAWLAVLSPKQVSGMEHVLPLWITSWSSKATNFLHTRVRIGVRVSSLNHHEMHSFLQCAGSQYLKAKYLLLEQKGIVNIVMHKDSTGTDILQAFVHALVMVNLVDKDTSADIESFSWMDKHYENFVLKWKTLFHQEGGWEITCCNDGKQLGKLQEGGG